jgi:hypothetical protein
LESLYNRQSIINCVPQLLELVLIYTSFFFILISAADSTISLQTIAQSTLFALILTFKLIIDFQTMDWAQKADHKSI